MPRKFNEVGGNAGFRFFRCVDMTWVVGFGDVLDWARQQVASRLHSSAATRHVVAGVAFAHNLVASAPPLGWLRKFGTVALLVYPGGDYEVFRPS